MSTPFGHSKYLQHLTFYNVEIKSNWNIRAFERISEEMLDHGFMRQADLNDSLKVKCFLFPSAVIRNRVQQ